MKPVQLAARALRRRVAEQEARGRTAEAALNAALRGHQNAEEAVKDREDHLVMVNEELLALRATARDAEAARAESAAAAEAAQTRAGVTDAKYELALYKLQFALSNDLFSYGDTKAAAAAAAEARADAANVQVVQLQQRLQVVANEAVQDEAVHAFLRTLAGARGAAVTAAQFAFAVQKAAARVSGRQAAHEC